MNSKLKTALYIAGLLALGSCTSDPTEPYQPGEETMAQTPYFAAPITITLGSEFGIDIDSGRAAPPGGGEEKGSETLSPDDGMAEYTSVNEVRVLTFRRKEFTSDPLVYDASNDLIIPIQADGVNAEHGHQHHIAQDSIKKVSGYEYKIIALAYDNAKVSTFPSTAYATKFKMPGITGDHNRFLLNITDGLTLDKLRANILTESMGKTRKDWTDFYLGHQAATDNFLDIYILNAGLLSRQAAEVPQIFYGECFTESGNEIVNFIEEETVTENGEETVKQRTDVGIHGILYRGMAKVDVNITLKKHNVGTAILPTMRDLEWIALMVEGMNGAVNLQSYDDFLSPYSPIEKYTPIVFRSVTANKENDVVTLSTYILPGKVKLAIRAKTSNLLTDYLMDGKIEPQDVEYFGNGTGIVSTDAYNGDFYFRRNHKYVLNISDSEKILQNHTLK